MKNLNKEEFQKKIALDYKLDKIMSIFSAFLLVAYFIVYVYLGNIYIYIWLVASGLNLLIWLNALLTTTRNKQILELIR